MTIAYRRANKQYVAMSEQDVWRFIGDQKVMFFALVAEDGYPHVTPVWFVAVDQKLYFRAQPYKVKARLADGAKVCCALEEGATYPEMRGAVIRGRSRQVGDEPSLIERVTAQETEKYRGMGHTSLKAPDEWRRERA